jgi:flavin reductase (DIM6/NTAB) family NADH-FMN oxidoreductase RutF
MAICREDFLQALRNWASGVTVVTTKDFQGNLHGITVSAFSSVSLTPPLVLVCIDKQAGSHDAFQESRAFVVNILSEDQEHVSRQFASPLPDKFAGIDFDEGIEGIPVLRGTLANLECHLMLTYEAGDHTIFIGEIQHSRAFKGKPLLYFQSDYGKLNKT